MTENKYIKMLEKVQQRQTDVTLAKLPLTTVLTVILNLLTSDLHYQKRALFFFVSQKARTDLFLKLNRELNDGRAANRESFSEDWLNSNPKPEKKPTNNKATTVAQTDLWECA